MVIVMGFPDLLMIGCNSVMDCDDTDDFVNYLQTSAFLLSYSKQLSINNPNYNILF